MDCLIWYAVMRRSGWAFSLSSASAAVFAVCLFPFSPFAPHHWFGATWLLLTAGALVLLANKPIRPFLWSVPGLFAGTALCFLQTSGFLATVLLFIAACVSPTGWKGRVRRGFYAGMGEIAALVCLIGPLAAKGAGLSIWRDLVVWPLKNYHRPGNPNDVALLVDIPSRLIHLWSAPREGRMVLGVIQAVSGTVLYAGVMLAAAACVAASVILVIKIFRREKIFASGWLASTATALVLLSFAMVNSTWVHLIYALPVVVFLWLCTVPVQWNSAALRKGVGLGMIGLLAAGLAYRGSLLVQTPPRPGDIFNVDRPDRDSALNKSLRHWKYLKPGDKIVVIPTGGNVYLYTYPSAIGYTYFFPLQAHYNDMRDHLKVAQEIAAERPAAVLVQRVVLAEFLSPADPVGKVLKRDYKPYGGSPAMVVFVPKGAVP
ncbi:MAG: hypothetical protein P8018_12860 [Acidobacteriota bacterium]